MKPLAVRSLLFVPGGRPDMVAKVLRWLPDVVVVDLEDAVAPPDKDAARVSAVAAVAALDHPAAYLRVNPPGTPWHAADVAAAGEAGAAGVVVPKLAAPLDVGLPVIAGLETARGVADARELLADAGVVAAYFGAEDYVADLGGRRTAGGAEVLYARSQVCLAARLAGLPAVDQAVVAVRDEAAFTADARTGRDLGYAGKICIHPGQVALAHAVFTPSEAEVAHARAVLAAEPGVGVVDGQMVDDVHRRMAAAVLRRAGES